MGLVIRIIVTFVAVVVAGYILPYDMFHFQSFQSAAIFAAVLAVINALVRPVIMLITCPLQLLTLGLSTFIINALLFMLAGSLTSGIALGGFLGALVASLVVSIVSTIISLVVKS
jgi:putative membrane protein